MPSSKKERVIPSYLIHVNSYDLLGNVVTVNGATTKEKCLEVLRRYNKSKNRRHPFKHNECYDKGYVSMDNGKVFFDGNGKRLVDTTWLRTCSCVNKIVDNNENLKSFLLGNL